MLIPIPTKRTTKGIRGGSRRIGKDNVRGKVDRKDKVRGMK